ARLWKPIETRCSVSQKFTRNIHSSFQASWRWPARPGIQEFKRLLDAGFQAILRLAARRDAEHLERPPLLYTVPGIAAQPRSARSDSRNNGISRRVRC